MRRTKKIAILAIIAMVLTMIPASLFAAPTDSDRLAGADRIQTALAIADAGTWGNTVILAAADNENLVDALAAAPLAGQENAPILLTYKNKLDPAVKQKIIDLKATKVYVIGAAYALAEEINAIDGVTVEMLTGDNRQVTAAAINAQLTNPSGTFIVGYDAIPDALSVASYAAKNNYAIAIAGSDGTYEDSYYGAAKYIIGGTAKVKDISGVERIAGADRYATNKAVSDKFSFSYERIYVANGVSLVDALAAAPLAAKYNAFVVLTDGKTVASPAGVTAATKVIAVGGPNAVSDAVKNSVYVPPAVFSVESVKAINAKQIEVVFNQPVVKSSAQSKDNYKIQTNADAAEFTLAARAGTAEVKLLDDQKTVIITTANSINQDFGGATPITKGTPFKFIVDKVMSVSGQELAKYTVTLVSDDKEAPTLVSAKASAKTTTTKVTLDFSEPVDVTGAIVYVGGKAATVQASTTKPTEAIVTTEQALSANTSYEVTLLNFKDFAGNFINPNPTTTNLTVTSDVQAPVVQSVNVVRDNLIEVTFDKEMDVNTFNANARVVDLNGNIQSTVTASVKPNTGGKTIRLALNSTVPFNVDNVFAGTLYLGDGIKDIVGNAKAASNHSVTITKDTVRPTLGAAPNTQYVAPGKQYAGTTYTNGAIVIKMSEEVTLGKALAPGDVKLITSTGVDDTTSKIGAAAPTVTFNADDAKEVIVSLAVGAGGLPVGNYTIRFGNDVLQDLSTQNNKNLAFVATVSASAASDTTKPVVTLATPVTSTAATSQTSGTTIQLTITDNTALDLDSVQNINNYLLDGKAMPAGTYVTLAHVGGSTDKDPTNVTVTINIPAKSIAKDKDYALNVNNIKDKAGNVADPKTGTVANLVDDISPELKTATISSNGLLVLEFTEKVVAAAGAGGATTLADLEFEINGVTVTGAQASASGAVLADGTGTDVDKYVVTFKAHVDSGADGNAATTADNRLFIDIDASGDYGAGDILIQTGTTKAVSVTTPVTPGPGTVDVDLSLLSGLKVKVSGNATITDRITTVPGSMANPIKLNTMIVVK
jgi:putative cell wall-binding protein